ncbi:MAG: hypothetical protein HY719_08170 [Planctomycetes bacterium]|nr:hypothetical protein [Planctomycetota bacterium]
MVNPVSPVSPASSPSEAGATPARAQRLYFRLDPGEPGVLRSSSPADSAAAVRMQETRNLNRLKGEAYREGRVVVDAGITYHRGLEGTTPVVRSAQTHVTSVEDNRSPVVAATRPAAGRANASAGGVSDRADLDSVAGGGGAGQVGAAMLARLEGGEAFSGVNTLKRELGRA